MILSVDGVQQFHARVGGSRPDVASTFDNSALGPSGFEAIITTGRLAPGEHEIVAFTVDSQARRYARIAQAMSFTIVADWKTLSPETPRRETGCEGNLDLIVDESRDMTLVVTNDCVWVPRGSLLSLRGWFFDPTTLSPLEAAYAIVDGERAYPGEYGAPRPDVGEFLGRPIASEIGFNIRIPTIALTRGTHEVEIVGSIDDGQSIVPTSIVLQFVVGQSTSARVPLREMTSAYLDDVVRISRSAARDVAAPLRLVRGDRIFVRGWAFDEPAREIAAGVTLLIDDRIEVPTLYGLPRPDIAETFENEALVRSGFTAEIDTALLKPGLHRAECRVLARDGRGALTTAQRFDFEVFEPSDA